MESWSATWSEKNSEDKSHRQKRRTMKNKLEVLQRCLLFATLDAASLPKIERIAQMRSFSKNEMIVEEGAKASGFYIVVRGQVKVFKLSESGAEHILHIIGEGGSFAEAVVFDEESLYPAFAEALTQVQALAIPKNDFLSLLRSDFALTLAVLRSMSEKLRYFNALIEELSLKSADARLAKYLLDLGRRAKSDVFSLDVKKVELARRLGIVPETLSRIFGRLKKQRVLSLSRHQIHLLRKDSLLDMASGASK
jgi:CRP-like cAMP-binding protein